MNISLKKIVASTCIVSGLAVSGNASAALSASFAASNMYFWRGLNISTPAPAISGSLDWSHDSGLYAGIWGSSEGAFDNSDEYDLYAGFSGEMGDFSYDLGYVAYLYPTIGDSTATDPNTGDPSPITGITDVDLNDAELADVYLSAGYGGFGADAYIGVGNGNDKSLYYTLGYSFDKYGITYGQQLNDGNDQWSHVTLDFAANDEISFGLSFGISGDVEIDEDPLFILTYSKSWDL